MNALVPLPIVLPLVGAAVSILAGRSRILQRVLGLSILTAVLAISVAMFIEVDHNGPLVAQGGGWPAPIGITLVVDRLSALLLVVSSSMLLVVLVYAIGQPGAERNHVGFQSVYLVLTAGVCASFITGDLFTLFVAFEMMLTASYVLITLGGKPEQVRTGMTYVVISLVASSLFVMTLAVLYTATGTVNMSDLAGEIGELPPGLRTAFALLLFFMFGIKAALFPLFFWLPDSYPTAPSPVTAIFAGLLTKVGVYAIIRTQTLLFPESSRPDTVILVIAGATMLVGILGAIAQDDVKRILSFNIVSHIGYMVMGLGFFTVAGLAGALFYMTHHIIVKTSLFLTGGLIEHVSGTSRLNRLGDMVRTAPVIAVLFLVSALNLAGVPPFSGFVAKVALVEAGLDVDDYAVVAVSVAVSLLTLFSMMKIWAGVFWSPATEPAEGAGHEVGGLGGPPLMVMSTAVLVLASLVLAVAAGPFYDFVERAAADLLDPADYLRAVLGS